MAGRDREFVGVTGSDAADFLQRMLSNDVVGLNPREGCDALLLTPKARVIAPIRVIRRGPEDFLLLTEPGLGDTVASQLLRARFAAKVAVQREAQASHVLFGDRKDAPDGAIAVPIRDYGVPAWEVVGDPDPEVGRLPADALERLRIEAGTPAFGREVDDRVLPAEAGLDKRAVSLTKGCYPGQEPIARQHYRGRVNRTLRTLSIEGPEPPGYDAEIRLEGKAVGRVTSAVADPGNSSTLALGYVRVEVPDAAALTVDGRRARLRAAHGSP